MKEGRKEIERRSKRERKGCVKEESVGQKGGGVKTMRKRGSLRPLLKMEKVIRVRGR
jgi:hypothetical protein